MELRWQLRRRRGGVTELYARRWNYFEKKKNQTEKTVQEIRIKRRCADSSENRRGNCSRRREFIGNIGDVAAPPPSYTSRKFNNYVHRLRKVFNIVFHRFSNGLANRIVRGQNVPGIQYSSDNVTRVRILEECKL